MERERLIELLGETPGIGWSPSAREMVADHLLANGVTVQRWIPVTERLPEDENTVLCTTRNGKPFVGRYNHKWKKWAVSGSVTVTHWMPLPEPPKEE